MKVILSVILIIFGFWLIGLSLSVNDLYRFTDRDRNNIELFRTDFGELTSCFRWPNCTQNVFCPDGGWDYGTISCRR